MIFTTQVTLPIPPGDGLVLWRVFYSAGPIPAATYYIHNPIQNAPGTIRLGDMDRGLSSSTGYPVAAGESFSLHVPGGVNFGAIADGGATTASFNLMIVPD